MGKDYFISINDVSCEFLTDAKKDMLNIECSEDRDNRENNNKT
jgi:hypothetical protein